jgi:tRNA G18 (ribose-2'-O)-methylase SpoU
MRKLTHSEISKQRTPLDDASLQQRMPIFALLDNIRSLYNVGSIFRSSDGVRLSRLYLTGFTPFPPRKEIDKTALGATRTVPWSYHRDPMVAVAELKSAGVKICALEITDGGKPYYEVTPAEFPLCLVVGNEITGVSKSLIDAADFAVEIPMVGNKQSLNVAVAYGIVLYDLLRVYRRQDSRPTQA